MLTQASIEVLRTRFDASGLDGNENIYAARNENDIAFVAINPNGIIKMFKSDGYPEDLLEQDIMSLCCSKYDDRLIHIPLDSNIERYDREQSDFFRIIIIELLAAFIVLVLGAFFLLIHWVLFKDLKTVLVIGGAICLIVVFYIIPKLTAQRKASGK
jgi:hypothetical protein